MSKQNPPGGGNATPENNNSSDHSAGKTNCGFLARRRQKKKKAIAIDRIRSVARPDQLAEEQQPTLPLRVGEQLLADGELFDFDENDPILQQDLAKQQEGTSSIARQNSSQEATTTTTTTTAAHVPPCNESHHEHPSTVSQSNHNRQQSRKNSRGYQLQKTESSQLPQAEKGDSDEMTRDAVPGSQSTSDSSTESQQLKSSSGDHQKQNVTSQPSGSSPRNTPQQQESDTSNRKNVESRGAGSVTPPSQQTTRPPVQQEKDESSTHATASFSVGNNDHYDADENDSDDAVNRSATPSARQVSVNSDTHNNAIKEREATSASLRRTAVLPSAFADCEDDDDSTIITGNPGLNNDEVSLLREFRNDIDKQEEQEYLEELQENIDKQEENDYIEHLDHDIQRETEREQQAVQNEASSHHREDDKEQEPVAQAQKNETSLPAAKSDTSQKYPSEENEISTELPRVSKKVPRWLGVAKESVNDPYLTTESFPTKVVQPFLHSLPPDLSSLPFTASLSDFPGDDESFLLKAQGNKGILQRFKCFFLDWLQVEFARKRHQDLIGDKKSVEFDVRLPKDDLLTVWAEGLLIEVSIGAQSLGLWVDFSVQAPSVERLFGPVFGKEAMQSGALAVAIRHIGVNEFEFCETKEDWEKLGDALQDKEDECILVTLCVSPSADLKSLDRSLVVGDLRSPDNSSVPKFVTVDTNRENVSSDSDIEPSLASRSWSAREEKDQPAKEKGAPHQPWEAKALKANQMFKTKYKPVYDIEYYRTDIGYQFVMSQMWQQHKHRFGSESCDDSCPCSLHIDYLCELVIQKWVTQQTRKAPTEWSLPDYAKDIHDSPVGFVNRFVPKFLPLLQEKYQDDGPNALLNRLLKMWNLGHLRQKNFGNRCDEHCSCLEGWKSVFREGDMESPVIQKKSAVNRLSEITQAIPRKRSRSEAASASVDTVAKSNVSRPATSLGSQMVQNPPSQSALGKRALPAANNEGQDKPAKIRRDLEPYCVSFDTSLPLGFYCITENRAGKRYCKVTSICPTGESKRKNNLIQEGTCVEAVEIWQGATMTKYPIHGHEDLLQYYNLAKENSAKSYQLKIWFVNTDVKGPSQKAIHTASTSSPIMSEDWSAHGKWRGKTTSGWPGGAEVVQHGKWRGKTTPGWRGGAEVVPHFTTSSHQPRVAPRLSGYMASVATTAQQLDSLSSANGPMRSYVDLANGKKNSSSNVEVLPYESVEPARSRREPAHRKAKPLPSALRAPRNQDQRRPKESRKILFGNVSEVMFYEKNSPSSHLLASRSAAGSSDNVDASAPAPSSETTEIPLTAAIEGIHKNDLKALVKELNKGLIRTDQRHPLNPRINWVTQEYDFTKREGFQKIHKLMSIFRAAAAGIATAQSLKSWCRYQIRIEKIAGFRLSEEASAQSGITTLRGEVCHSVNHSEKKLPALPLMDIGETIDYGAGNAPLPEYDLHVNPLLEEELSKIRELRICMYTTEGEVLAQVRLPMEKVSQVCKAFGEEKAIEIDLKCSDLVQPGARICLRATKRHAPLDYVRAKKQVGSEELQKSVEWIERFNSIEDCKLKAQIRGKHNFSLLHAAVVYENHDLVQKILSLGADPNSKSDLGSVSALAMSMMDREREKFHGINRKPLEESEKEKHRQRVARLDNIAKMILFQSNLQKKDSSASSVGVDQPPKYTKRSLLTNASTSKGSHGRVDAGSAAANNKGTTNSSPSSPDEDGSSSERVSTMSAVTPFLASQAPPQNFAKKANTSASGNPLYGKDKAGKNSLLDGEAGLAAAGNINDRKCYNCDKHGHIAKDCPEKKKKGGHGKKTSVSQPNLVLDKNDVPESFLEGNLALGKENGLSFWDVAATSFLGNSSSTKGSGVSLSVTKKKEVAIFCRALSRAGEGWIPSAQVALEFYALLGQKDNAKFRTARSIAAEEDFTECGRPNAAKNDIIQCDEKEAKSGLAPELYIRLTRSGKALMSMFILSGGAVGASSLPPLSGKRKATDSVGASEPEPKRRGNPVAIRGLDDASLATTPPLEAHSSTCESKLSGKPAVNLNVLGGVSKFTVPVQEEEEVQVPGYSDDVKTILLSIGKHAEGWVSNSEVASEFYSLAQTREKDRFRSARSDAEEAGLVKWGRRDLGTAGEPVVEVDRTTEDRMSLDSYLKLTPQGWRAFRSLHPESEEDDMKVLLQCMIPMNGKETVWLGMNDIVRSFYAKCGSNDEGRFMKLRELATRDKLVDWGRSDSMRSGSVKVATASQFRGLAPEAFLRLTTRGHERVTNVAHFAPGRNEDRSPGTVSAVDNRGRPSRRSIPTDAPAHARHSHRRSLRYEKGEPDQSLPLVVDTWFTGANRQPCKYFGSTLDIRCKGRFSCTFPHIQPPLKDLLNNKELRPQYLDGVQFLERADEYGRVRITASYHDKRKNIYYCAEGGSSGRRNTQDIWWYPTTAEAQEAVEFVYAASRSWGRQRPSA